MEIVDESTYVGRVLDCYVYRNVEKAGTTAIHQCSVGQRFKGWLEGFGLCGEIVANNCTSTCKGRCEVYFKIEWSRP